MPHYEIVDFYYDSKKLSDDNFKSREGFKKYIIDHYDSKGTAESWMDHSDWHENVSPKGRTIGGKVDDVNEDYIKEIRDDIEKANTDEALDKINKDVDTDYEDDTQDILKRQIGERLETISETKTTDIRKEFDDAIKDAVSKAERAKTSEDVDTELELPYSIGELRRTYGKDFASDMSMFVAEATEQLFTIRQDKAKE